MAWLAKFRCNPFIKLLAKGLVSRRVDLLCGQVSYRRARGNVPIALKDVIGHGAANVNSRAEPTSQFKFMVRVRSRFVNKHYPIIPSKFTEIADVSAVSFHLGFRGLALEVISVKRSVHYL